MDNCLTPEQLTTLENIQRRILWLSTLIVHHANNVRPNSDGTKVGGHQASSASVVTILTALYFHFLRAGDRVSIKPHASPAYHAVQYLLGQLPREYLTTLRAFHGLQAYPSRTKDVDPVDFSTGSVGLGATAPAFAALTHRYVKRLGPVTSRRFVAVLGDAELDEGNVWEAVLEESIVGLDNLLWIVDLNRQSLDRVIPGIKAARLKRLFADHGWRVLEAKYGCRLQALFAQPRGHTLRQRIDDMSNEEYQALIRLPGNQLRVRLAQGAHAAAIEAVVASVPDAELPQVISNLGGHDLMELASVLAQADAVTSRPTVIFAYTIKGWGLPIAGHPLNHSALLNQAQVDKLRETLGIEGDEWARFAETSPEGRWCAKSAARLYSADAVSSAGDRQPQQQLRADEVPDELPISTQGKLSTQDVFGRLLVRLADEPALRARIVTISPDVSVSTNLGGWINKVGVFSLKQEADYESEAQRLLQWKPGPDGQHIELGISEMNLFMLLGMLGLSAELCGQPLIPIGTVYDPFIARGLDALIYGLYSGAKFIFVGTPSGITLAPEGGAHQSTITPSLGTELPNLNFYEPCFARELGWILLQAIRECCDRQQGRATYLRLSTKPIDQNLLSPALQRLGAPTLQQQVLAGGYRLVDAHADYPETRALPRVNIATAGVMIPEAIEAAAHLREEGIAANVLNLVSPRALFETWQAARRAQRHDPFAARAPLDWLLPESEQHVPIITVQDGASHSLAWLGSVYGAPIIALGVDEFGQSGARADLYQHFGIGAAQIAEAALNAWELWVP